MIGEVLRMMMLVMKLLLLLLLEEGLLVLVELGGKTKHQGGEETTEAIKAG